jgi:stage V sporulation protein AF
VPLDKSLKKNLSMLDEQLGIEIGFDIILREIKVGSKDAALVFLDGFVHDLATQEVISSLMEVRPSGLTTGAVQQLMEEHIPHFETFTVSDFDELVQTILSGPMALLVDGISEAVIIDVRQYPSRSIEEPELERVTRGSREGFLETGLFNINLIRRRLRDPGLRFEAFQVGKRSATDVFIGYIEDIVDPELLSQVRQRLNRINVSALPLGSKSLEEYVFGTKHNPFPVVRYTERPDVVAAHLLEGHIVIITDTTPAAMIVPVTAWHFTQHAEDYFNNPVVGTYIRWLRFLAFLTAFLLTPLWLALVQNQSALPPILSFIGPREEAAVPIFLQFVMLELAIDMTRMAFIHTPSAVAASLGLIAAILLGQFAVDVGLFVPETILYQAVAALAFFAIPNYEFGMATRLFRLLVLILTGLFSLWGLAAGVLATVLVMVFTKSLGLPYLWPLVPWHWPSLKRLLFRYPIPTVSRRPPFTRPVDADIKETDKQQAESSGPKKDSSSQESAAQPALGKRIPKRPRKVGRAVDGSAGQTSNGEDS